MFVIPNTYGVSLKEGGGPKLGSCFVHGALLTKVMLARLQSRPFVFDNLNHRFHSTEVVSEFPLSPALLSTYLKPIAIERGSEGTAIDDWASLPLFKGASSNEGAWGTKPNKFCSLQLDWSAFVSGLRNDYSKRNEEGESYCGWITPTASEVGFEMNLVDRFGKPYSGFGRAYRPNGSLKQRSLQLQVNFFIFTEPTPLGVEVEPLITQMTKGEVGTKTIEPPKHERGVIEKVGCLEQSVNFEHYRGWLNPRWIEYLMGLPLGWVALGAHQIYRANCVQKA